MSPNDRDRAREKRRSEKHQTRLDLRDAESRRNRQVLGVVLALVVVIGGFVALSQVLNKDKNSPSKPAAATGQSPVAGQSPATGQPTSAPKNLVAGCVAAPKIPAEARKGTLPDKSTAAGKTFVATVTTNCGVIKMELDGTKAPQTVASFLGLAKSDYWADSPCHRLTTGGIFVLQCGDPTGTGGGNPGDGYGYGVENAPADFTYAPGTLAMARTDTPKGNGGQFFIVYEESELKDPVGYTIFGKITSGMDIVDKVAAAGTNTPGSSDAAPMQPISILKVDVAEKKASQ